MVEFFTRDNTRFISSYQLYHALKKNRPNASYYFFWVRRELIQNITIAHGHDYIQNHYYRNHLPAKGRPPKDYLLNKNLAIAICIKEKTVVARKVKEFLQVNM